MKPAFVAATIAAFSLSQAAVGGWQSQGSGAGATAAKTMPGGNVPSGSAVGSNVTLSWSASAFASGESVSGYVVKRYDALGNPSSALAGCAGVVSGTSCTENGVPIGTWKYTITPAQGDWRGAASGQSAPVIVLI